MPTAASMRSKLRAFLDDEQSVWAKGSMWSNNELDAALDVAQLSFVRYSYMKQYWHLLSRLHATTAGSSPLSLPADYLFYSSSQIESAVPGTYYPAVLYMGYGALNLNNDNARYVAVIRGNTVTFNRGFNSANGIFSYYRRPTKITGASNHTDMIDPCYDAMVYHAAAILQQKDFGQCQRAIKSMKAVVDSITQDPTNMYPPVVNQNTEA